MVIATCLNRVISRLVAIRAGRTLRPGTIPVEPTAELKRLPHTARCLMIEAMKEYVVRSGKQLLEAKVVHITPILEMLLRQDLLDDGLTQMGTHEKPIRPKLILGMRPVWDAKVFHLTQR